MILGLLERQLEQLLSYMLTFTMTNFKKTHLLGQKVWQGVDCHLVEILFFVTNCFGLFWIVLDKLKDKEYIFKQK